MRGVMPATTTPFGADGSVDLPAVLHPYLGGKTRISAAGVLE
jgi:hypothetical protein